MQPGAKIQTQMDSREREDCPENPIPLSVKNRASIFYLKQAVESHRRWVTILPDVPICWIRSRLAMVSEKNVTSHDVIFGISQVLSCLVRGAGVNTRKSWIIRQPGWPTLSLQLR